MKKTKQSDKYEKDSRQKDRLIKRGKRQKRDRWSYTERERQGQRNEEKN